MPKNILAYGTGNLDVAANAISSTANFLKAHGWRPGAGYQPGEPNFNYARHAISIDENRKDFARVPWSSPRGRGKDASGIQWFEQVWFAGKHSDIGGSSGKRIEVVGHRAGAVMHASVYRRFDHEAVRLTDAFGAYRPLTLRRQDDFKRFYNPSAQFPANSYHGAACLARGLYPVLQLTMKPLAGRGSSGERQQTPLGFSASKKGVKKSR